MSNYTITTDFGAKDDLPSGNASKVIKGSEFTTEFTNIKTAVNSKADSDAPTFTGATTFSGTVTLNDDVTFDTNTMFVDVSTNRVGIGNVTPSTALDVTGVITTDGLTSSAGIDVTGGVTMDGGSTSADFSFGDNNKAKFGAENDLQIFHTGSYSAIRDVGTGGLFIGGENYVDIGNASASETYARFHKDAQVDLYHNNVKKLSTTSTGVDVTGTVTASALDVTGGDIRFYEDTGTTAKFLWDASAESLTVGGTGDDGYNLNVESAADTSLSLFSSSNPSRAVISTHGGNEMRLESRGGGSASMLTMYTGAIGSPTERLRIDSSGNVGIGTTSPDTLLNLAGDETAVIRLENTNGSVSDGDVIGALQFYKADGSGAGAGVVGQIKMLTQGVGSGGHLTLSTGDSSGNDVERVRINSNGNVGIGTTSPATSLHVFNESDTQIRLSQSGEGSYDLGVIDGDKFTINRDGVTNEFVMSEGKVGIGTSSPSANLHVSSSGDAIARITSADGNSAFLDLGDASDPDGGRIVYDSGSNLALYTASTERMRIDSSGNLLLHPNNSGRGLKITTGTGQAVGSDTTYDTIAAGYGQHIFKTDGSERLRIDSSGNLLVGKTSTALTTAGIALRDSGLGQFTVDGNPVLELNRETNSGTLVDIRQDGTTVGSISVSSSATSYNTSSDQRLKENIADADDAGGKIDAIQVRQFDWKADGSHQDYGVIAQELIEVAPEAVTEGETEDEMMSVDYSKLVPTLIKEIQTLRNRVAQLENN